MKYLISSLFMVATPSLIKQGEWYDVARNSSQSRITTGELYRSCVEARKLNLPPESRQIDEEMASKCTILVTRLIIQNGHAQPSRFCAGGPSPIGVDNVDPAIETFIEFVEKEDLGYSSSDGESTLLASLIQRWPCN